MVEEQKPFFSFWLEDPGWDGSVYLEDKKSTIENSWLVTLHLSTGCHKKNIRLNIKISNHLGFYENSKAHSVSHLMESVLNGENNG